MRRFECWIAYALFASMCCYFLLPFATPVPGFSTFTLPKALALVLVVATAGWWMAAGPRRDLGRSLRVWWPFLALAGWLPVMAMLRPSFAFLDAKLLAGYSGAALAGLLLARVVASGEVRARAVRIVLWGGAVAVAAALVEPATTPTGDWLWRWFRPYLAVWNPVLGTTSELRTIHWNSGGFFRLSGIFSAPNQLANFLVMWFPLVGAFLVAIPPSGLIREAGLLLGISAASVAFARTMTRSSLLGSGLACAVALVLLAAGRIMALPRARRRDLIRSVAFRLWSVALVALAVVLVWLVRTNRANALVAGHVAMAGVALAMLAVAWLARRAPGKDPILGDTALRFGALGLVILIAPAILLAGGPPSRAQEMTPPATGGRMIPETHQPATAGERFTESALHAGWERLKLWRVAAWMLRDAPLVGPGYHRFYDTIRNDEAVKERYDLVAFFGDLGVSVDNPHNLYLTAALAGGLMGLGLLLHGIVVLLRVSLIRALDLRLPVFDRALGAATLWYWCAYAGLGLVGQNVFIVEDAVVFFTWAALTLSFRGRA